MRQASGLGFGDTSHAVYKNVWQHNIIQLVTVAAITGRNIGYGYDGKSFIHPYSFNEP